MLPRHPPFIPLTYVCHLPKHLIPVALLFSGLTVTFWVPGSIPLLKAKASSTGGLTAIAKVEEILEELLNSSLKMDSCHFYIILYPLPQRWLKKEDLVCVPGGRSIYFWIVS